MTPISATAPREATVGRHLAQHRAGIEARDIFAVSGESLVVGACCKELNAADGGIGDFSRILDYFATPFLGMRSSTVDCPLLLSLTCGPYILPFVTDTWAHVSLGPHVSDEGRVQ